MSWADEEQRRADYLAEIDLIYRRRPDPLDRIEALLLRVARFLEER